MNLLLRVALSLYLFVALALASFTAAATDDPDQVRALLARMAESTRQLDYKGLFIYRYGGAQESLRVLHTVKNGTEYESLQHLNGPPREIVRAGRSVSCSYIGDQLLAGRLESLPADFEGLDRFYHFYVRGRERVAGRAAWVLDVVPRDQFRYGYSLSIDTQTGLLLKSLLVGRNKKVLESFEFVELEIGAVAALSDNQSLSAVSSSRRVADHRLSGCNPIEVPESQLWAASWLPAGFVFTGQERKQLEGGGRWRDTLMYTDGLTSFSAFIEPVASESALDGRAQKGATVVYLSSLRRGEDSYRVTVVGEVPLQTAQRVASAIVPVAESGG